MVFKCATQRPSANDQQARIFKPLTAAVGECVNDEIVSLPRNQVTGADKQRASPARARSFRYACTVSGADTVGEGRAVLEGCARLFGTERRELLKIDPVAQNVDLLWRGAEAGELIFQVGGDADDRIRSLDRIEDHPLLPRKCWNERDVAAARRDDHRFAETPCGIHRRNTVRIKIMAVDEIEDPPLINQALRRREEAGLQRFCGVGHPDFRGDRIARVPDVDAVPDLPPGRACKVRILSKSFVAERKPRNRRDDAHIGACLFDDSTQTVLNKDAVVWRRGVWKECCEN